MNENNYIHTNYGLSLYPNATEPDNENGIYFLILFYILKNANKSLVDADIENFKETVENLTTYSPYGRIKGLYDRVAGDSLDIEKSNVNKISHDNLSAISAFSRLFSDKMSFHKELASYGYKKLMKYDNGYPDSPRWIYKQKSGQTSTSFQWHPRDWFFWLTNGGYWWAWVFFPVFFFANIISCFSPKEKTSGKLLMFMRLESGSNWSSLMWLNKKICYWVLRKKYGKDWLNQVCSIYFWQEETSPIRELAKGLDL